MKTAITTKVIIIKLRENEPQYRLGWRWTFHHETADYYAKTFKDAKRFLKRVLLNAKIADDPKCKAKMRFNIYPMSDCS